MGYFRIDAPLSPGENEERPSGSRRKKRIPHHQRYHWSGVTISLSGGFFLIVQELQILCRILTEQLIEFHRTEDHDDWFHQEQKQSHDAPKEHP